MSMYKPDRAVNNPNMTSLEHHVHSVYAEGMLFDSLASDMEISDL